MCENCGNTGLKVNVRQHDPTRTTTLRNAFVADMNRRFNRVAKAVNEAVIVQDVFGLTPQKSIRTFQTPGKRAFSFLTKDEKIAAFLDWLRKVENAVLLEMQPTVQYGKWEEVPWTNVYLFQAYQQGTKRARQELRKYGLSLAIESADGQVFLNPTSLEKLRVLFTRAFTDLEGVTHAMDEQISRILAQGLVDGQSPRVLAKMINSAIIGGGEELGMQITYINRVGRQVSYFMPGRRRAEIIARTEIIRAHHVATIQEYRNWAIEGVYVLAEWATAGDARVCPDCAGMQGKVFSLDEVENLIPLHPQCRCIALPYVDVKRTKPGVIE